MSWPLRKSTASQGVPLGTFVDVADGDTPVTGLTIANTDIKLQKAGATTKVGKNSGGATHISGGDYYAVLDATDSDTAGPMRISVHAAGALAVWLDCVVYEQVVYDALFAAGATGKLPATLAAGDVTGNLPANVIKVNGTDQTAGDLAAALATITGYIDTEVAAIKAKTDLLPTWPTNFAALVISSGGLVRLDLTQPLSSARDVTSVGDTSLTINDALHCAAASTAGREGQSGTTYTTKTSAGTTLRIFTLDSATAPMSRT